MKQYDIYDLLWPTKITVPLAMISKCTLNFKQIDIWVVAKEENGNKKNVHMPFPKANRKVQPDYKLL